MQTVHSKTSVQTTLEAQINNETHLKPLWQQDMLTDYHTDTHTKKNIYTSIHTCLHLIYLYAENCISMKHEFCHISPENFIKNTTLLQLLCTRIRPLQFNAMHPSISQKRKQHTCIATIAVQSFKQSTTCI